ncbi:hypothetical protein RIF29_20151 [Crotalaria pallida]|uniref:Uncharacterized protein n=1 Tax=Crotalaria pallida TaxID=3830 RepID=A0AAN9F136_CROPI
MVVSRNSKDLVEVIKELDDYFLKAANASAKVSFLLQVPTAGFSDHTKVFKTAMSIEEEEEVEIEVEGEVEGEEEEEDEEEEEEEEEDEEEVEGEEEEEDQEKSTMICSFVH